MANPKTETTRLTGSHTNTPKTRKKEPTCEAAPQRPAASLDPPRCFPSPNQPLSASPSAEAGGASRCCPAGATSPPPLPRRMMAVVGTLNAMVEPPRLHPTP